MGLKDCVVFPSDVELANMKTFDGTISISTILDKEGISIEDLIRLEKQGYFRTTSLHDVLENCELYFQPVPAEPRDSELEKRVTKLKAEQENREYRAMTKNVSSAGLGGQALSFREDVKSVSAQLTAVINFVLTVGGTFVFVYKAVEYALPEPNIPAQVMMGIVSSTVVALADLFFLARTI